MMKRLSRFLCRWPWLYFQIMRFRKGAADEKRLYLTLLRRGDVVFDVGANIGYFSDLFASIIGKKGQLFSFEPSPETVKKLKHSVEGQSCPMQIINAACGEAEGTVELFQKGEDSGQASLRQQSRASWEGGDAVQTFSCKIIRLDGFIQKEKVNHLDFLKCDVEGAEMLVFRGLGDELKRLKPLLFFELFPAFLKSFGFQPQDLFDHLRGQGYDLFFEAGEMLKPVSAERLLALNENSEPLNILALISSHHEESLIRLKSRGLLGASP